MNPSIIDHWAQLDGDTQLNRALKKTIKDQANDNLTILDYQLDYLNEALKFVKNFNCAIDAGANYGLMSYHLNQRFKQIHAFEIYTDVRKCLRKNISNFNLNNVIVYDFGLGEKEKLVSLNHSRGTFGTFIDPNNSSGDSLIKPIDSLNLSSLDFIKIDCEGYEPFILNGAKITIKKFNPVILMERKGHTTRWGLDKYEPVNILKEWGYVEKISYKKDCIMVKE